MSSCSAHSPHSVRSPSTSTCRRSPRSRPTSRPPRPPCSSPSRRRRSASRSASCSSGPWSDKVGRRLPLIIATVLHIGSSLGIVLAPDIVWVGIFRVLQGVGAAGGGVVAMAMVRDLFGGLPLVRMLSTPRPRQRARADPGPGHRIAAAAHRRLARHLRLPHDLRRAGGARRHLLPRRDPTGGQARGLRAQHHARSATARCSPTASSSARSSSPG